MLYLDKKHDPGKNSNLLSEITGKKQNISLMVEETDRLFQQYCMNHPNDTNQGKRASSLKELVTKVFRFPFAMPARANICPFQTYVDEDGNVYPEWKKKLDEQYGQLVRKIKREVNIEEYGGVGDGKTDNTHGF